MFGESYGCKELQKTSERFIHSHFASVANEDEFKTLLTKDLLVQLLHSENLRIDNEFQVFEIAISWILCDVTQRRKHLFDLMCHIRFPIISQNQLEAYVNKVEDLSLKVALQKTVYDNYQLRALAEARRRPYLFVPRRCARKCVYVVGGYSREEGGRWSDSHSLTTVQCYNTYNEEWMQLASMTSARSGHGVCAVNGLVYAIGGENDSLIFDGGEVYDAAQNEWTPIAPMTSPRCGLGVAVVDEEIYAFGGWIGSEIGRTVEKYDPAEKTWTEVGSSETLRFSMGVLEHKGTKYTIGAHVHTFSSDICFFCRLLLASLLDTQSCTYMYL